MPAGAFYHDMGVCSSRRTQDYRNVDFSIDDSDFDRGKIVMHDYLNQSLIRELLNSSSDS